VGSKSTQKSALFRGDGPIEIELMNEQRQVFESLLASIQAPPPPNGKVVVEAVN